METAFDAGGPAPAGFWVRVVAVLIDALVVFVTEFLFGLAAGSIWGGAITESTVFKATVAAFMIVFVSVYCVVLHARFGQTVGKMVVGVRVEPTAGGSLSVGTSILRYGGYLVSVATFLIGYLMVGLRRDKRALHDLLAGTRVIRVGVPAPTPEWAPAARRS